MPRGESEPTAPMHPIFGDARKNWGWLLALGVLSTILGVFGLGMALAFTLAGVLLFGVLLLVGGAFQLVDAFTQKGWKGTLVLTLIALIYLAAGVLIVLDPIGAAVALTLLLGGAFVIIGALRVGTAFQHKGVPGWGWALAGGLVTVLLGLLVVAGWPVSGLWVIGLIISIELIINGITHIAFGLAARRAGQKNGETSGGAAHGAA